jgi:hypothetical protein
MGLLLGFGYWAIFVTAESFLGPVGTGPYLAGLLVSYFIIFAVHEVLKKR